MATALANVHKWLRLGFEWVSPPGCWRGFWELHRVPLALQAGVSGVAAGVMSVGGVSADTAWMVGLLSLPCAPLLVQAWLLRGHHPQRFGFLYTLPLDPLARAPLLVAAGLSVPGIMYWCWVEPSQLVVAVLSGLTLPLWLAVCLVWRLVLASVPNGYRQSWALFPTINAFNLLLWPQLTGTGPPLLLTPAFLIVGLAVGLILVRWLGRRDFYRLYYNTLLRKGG